MRYADSLIQPSIKQIFVIPYNHTRVGLIHYYRTEKNCSVFAETSCSSCAD